MRNKKVKRVGEITPAEFRRVRIHLRFSQAELAEQLKVATNTVSSWEQGKRPIPGVATVALAYVSRTRRPDRRPHGN